MKKITNYILILFSILFVINNRALAQDTLRIWFKEDEKKIDHKGKFKLCFVQKGVKYSPIRTKNPELVIMPDQIDREGNCEIIFEYKKYKANYGQILVKKIKDELIFGVDNRPFEAGQLSGDVKEKDIKIIYYLVFPNGTVRTNEILYKYKK